MRRPPGRERLVPWPERRAPRVVPPHQGHYAIVMMHRVAVLSALLVLVLVAGTGCDSWTSGDQGFYVRFERLSGEPQRGVRPLVVGDRIHWTGSVLTSEATDTGYVDHPELRWATVTDGAIVGLGGSGRSGVLATADWQTFTQVSSENFDLLASSGMGLVALRHASLGRYVLFFSRDDGATWKAGAELSAGFDIGDGDSATLQSGFEGRVRATITIQLTGFDGNVDYASQTYDIDGETATVVGRTGNPEILRTPPPFPDLVTAGGLGLFPDTDGMVLFSGDSTSLVLVRNPADAVDLAAGERLRWAVVDRDEYTLHGELRALGVDSKGRLLVASPIAVFRSVKAFEQNERSDILKGPGCDGRSSWDVDDFDDDNVNVTVRNASGLRLTVHQVLEDARWQWIGTLEPDGELALSTVFPRAATPNARVMFTNNDDTCVAVLVVPDAEEATLTVEAL
jgi:hypothetical protein